jgi:hypothetical protein
MAHSSESAVKGNLGWNRNRAVGQMRAFRPDKATHVRARIAEEA